MKDVILRHHPELTPALEGLPNAFLPWHHVAAEQGSRPLARRVLGLKKAAAELNSDSSSYAG